MDKGPLKKTRELKESDENFLFSSYLKSFRCSSDNLRMSNDIYYYNFKKLINKLIEKSKVVILCDDEDDDLVYGYCIYDSFEEILILHYVYIRYTFRKLGLARYLYETLKEGHEAVVSSHANKVFDDLRGSEKYRRIGYNPFLRKL